MLTFRLSLPDGGYRSRATRAAFVQALSDRLASAPGITAAAVNSRLPLSGSRGADAIAIEGRAPSPGERLIADQRQVTPDYFRAMNIPILEGRGFTPRDDAAAEAIAVVNRAMVNRFWPDTSPLNARVRIAAGPSASQWIRIVGIVGDVHHIALNRPAVPEMYRPYAQEAVADFSVVVITAGEPATAARVSRAAVEAIDRDLPVYDMRTMAERIAGSFAEMRATMLLLLLTAALAAALAGTAIYGSIWYAVSLKIPEIGIRLALGATPGSVCGRIILQSIGLTLVGAAVGTAAALAVGPMLRTLLFDTRPTDPGTYLEVMLVLLALTIVASVTPARRAMRVDPMTALRSE
jgi:predicted permease